MLSNKMRSIIGVLLVVTTLAGCGSGNSDSLTKSSENNGAQLVAISITPTNSQIAANTSQKLSAIGIYSDNSKKDLTGSVTWSTSDTAVTTFSAAAKTSAKASIAMLSQSGTGHAYAYGIQAGHANIMATSGGTSGSTPITVTNATLVSIAVTPPNPSIAKGTTVQLAATGTFSDGTTQDLTAQVIWSSSDAGVATVGTSGLATSIAAGSTTVTATSGSISGSDSLTVTPATLVSIEVAPANQSISQGTSQQCTATGTFSDDTTQDLTASAIWSSSNTGVATVSNAADSNGLAASVAAGTTTITAASGSITGSTSLTVNPATLVSITVTPSNPSITQGANQQFTATGTFSDSTTQNLTAAVTWNSSAAGVASISNAAGSKGLATAVAPGTTTITAVSGGVSGSATLTVTAITVTKSATLAWNAPTTNTDGTSLTDLAGYKIYYGTSSGNYATSVNVGNVTTYTINNLSTGTYYFAVTAYDSSAVESYYSNQVSKTF
jgi:hypothetical protein